MVLTKIHLAWWMLVIREQCIFEVPTYFKEGLPLRQNLIETLCVDIWYSSFLRFYSNCFWQVFFFFSFFYECALFHHHIIFIALRVRGLRRSQPSSSILLFPWLPILQCSPCPPRGRFKSHRLSVN